MKTIIVGSAMIDDYNLVDKVIGQVIKSGWKVTEVVIGGTYSVDKEIKRWAKDNNIKHSVVTPNWEDHGYHATILRNKEMVDGADGIILINADTKELSELRRVAYMEGLRIRDVIV